MPIPKAIVPRMMVRIPKTKPAKSNVSGVGHSNKTLCPMFFCANFTKTLDKWEKMV